MSAADVREAPAPAEIESAPDEVRYGTRWGIFAKAFTPALAVVATIVTCVVTGALAVSFVAENATLRLATSGFKANGVGLGSVLVDHGGGGGKYYEARIGVADARVNGLCISQNFRVLGLDYTLLIRGGDTDPATYEVQANGLLIDAAHLDGQVHLSGPTAVNKNAADVQIGDSGLSLNGDNQRFGLQADGGTFKQVVGTVHDIVVPNALDVPKLDISVVSGNQPCPTPPAPTR
jgi:hypothetical protein